MALAARLPGKRARWVGGAGQGQQLSRRVHAQQRHGPVPDGAQRNERHQVREHQPAKPKRAKERREQQLRHWQHREGQQQLGPVLARALKHADAGVGPHGIAQQGRGRRRREVVESRKDGAEARQMRRHGQRVHRHGFVADGPVGAPDNVGPGGRLRVEVGEGDGGRGLAQRAQGRQHGFGAAAGPRAQLEHVGLGGMGQARRQQRRNGAVGAQGRNHKPQVVHHPGPDDGREPGQIFKLEQPQA